MNSELTNSRILCNKCGKDIGKVETAIKTESKGGIVHQYVHCRHCKSDFSGNITDIEVRDLEGKVRKARDIRSAMALGETEEELEAAANFDKLISDLVTDITKKKQKLREEYLVNERLKGL